MEVGAEDFALLTDLTSSLSSSCLLKRMRGGLLSSWCPEERRGREGGAYHAIDFWCDFFNCSFLAVAASFFDVSFSFSVLDLSTIAIFYQNFTYGAWRGRRGYFGECSSSSVVCPTFSVSFPLVAAFFLLCSLYESG